MVGLDTGFFIALMKKDKKARGKPAQGKKMVKGIETACSVKVVDQEITEMAAGLKHGRGMPYVDSFILATFMIAGCQEIHTSDKNHFQNLGQKGLSVVFW